MTAKRKYKKRGSHKIRNAFIALAALAALVVLYYPALYDEVKGFLPETAPLIQAKSETRDTPVNDQPPALLPMPAPEEEVSVHFIDLGQADGILIRSGKNAVLIDGGEYKTRNTLIKYLRDAGVATLDYVVATHPHSDHIGGLAPVIRQFDVKNVLMPDAINNTSTFEHLLAAIEEKDIPVTVPAAGDKIAAGTIEFTVLAPGKKFDDLNNASLVLRMTHGRTAFLFTGDAEIQSEKEMLKSGLNLRADVMKAGHHGSRTSTSDDFLDAVRPNIVVVTCGQKNSYSHPHREFLGRISRPGRNITLLRTDEAGTIVMTTNGIEIK